MCYFMKGRVVMSYTALYRKFRPSGFEDVKGQDHIVTTLKNQIKADRIGHAYLFCGTRGTGKTSIAKIFAKSVNCEHPVDGSPCNECRSCKTIAAGASMNVIEIDAASNNGVDNIREIRDEVQYSPTEGKFKVYIIDEVHMLSIGAFNALLKTLEEPPAYVIFVLATTEAHKIPITILSRCQRYDFKRITIETITDRLKSLMDLEQVEVDDRALRYIAKAGDGSLRDALSLLDQCIAFYIDQRLTYDNVLEVLGAVDTEVFSKLLRNVISGDIIKCMEQLEDMIMLGRDLSQFVTDFTWYLRNLLLVKTSDHLEDVIDASSERMEALKEEAEMISVDTLMRYIRIFSELSNQIKYASQKRVLIEIAIIKLARPAMETDVNAILDRLSTIERQLENGVVMSTNQTTQTQIHSESGQQNSVQRKKPELEAAVPEDVQEAVNRFRKIEGKLTGPVKMYLRGVRFSAGGENRLVLVFQDPIGYEYVNKPGNKELLENLVSDEVGKKIEIDMKLLGNDQNFEDSFVEVQNKINMEIIVEEHD